MRSGTIAPLFFTARQGQSHPMSDIVIAYHSGYGHTKLIAETIAETSGGKLLPIDAEGQLPAGGWESLAAARTIVFGTPTYMGGPSWQFKRFADASSKPWFVQAWKDKLACGFTQSATMNGDKLSTLHYLMTLSQQQGMIWFGTGMMPANQKASTRNDVNYVGSSCGLMTVCPADAGAHEMPEGDLETARRFGQRIADITRRFSA